MSQQQGQVGIHFFLFSFFTKTVRKSVLAGIFLHWRMEAKNSKANPT